MKSSATPVLCIVVALMSAEVLGVFEVTMLFAAMPHLLAEFGSPATVGWLFSAFALVSAMCAALGARAGDMFGRRRVLLIAVVMGIVGSLIAGLSSDLSGVLMGRILQGSSGAIFPLCIGLLREHVQGPKAPIAIGVLTATITISAGAALVIGGAIVDHLSWRWIFIAGAGAGVVAALLLWFWVPPSTNRAPSSGVNYFGGLLFAPALAALLMAVSFSGEWGWTDSRILGLLLAGGVLLASWIASELRAKLPLIDVRLLTNRQVALANFVIILLGLTAIQKDQVLSLLLQQPTWTGMGLGNSATVAGLILLPSALAGFLGGPGSGWLVTRIGGGATMAIGAVLLMVGWSGLMFTHGSVLVVGLWAALIGLGMSVIYSIIPILIVDRVPMERTSEAVGISVVLRSAFLGVGAQIIAVLLASSVVSDPSSAARFPDSIAYATVFGYMMAGSAVMLLVSFMLPWSIASLRSPPA